MLWLLIPSLLSQLAVHCALGDGKRQFIPQTEATGQVAAAELCRYACPSVAEQVIDFSMGKNKTLDTWGYPEASLLAFVISGRAMRLLDKVVLALGCRDGDVIRRAQSG
jgi:hypothetical protein